MKWAIVKQKRIGLYLCEQRLGKFVMCFHNEHRFDLEACMNRDNKLHKEGHYRSLHTLTDGFTIAQRHKYWLRYESLQFLDRHTPKSLGIAISILPISYVVICMLLFNRYIYRVFHDFRA